MKKRIIFLIVFLSMILHPGYLGKGASDSNVIPEASLTLLSSDDKGVVFELTTPAYEIQSGDSKQQDYQLVNVPGLDQISKAGKPQLPVKGLMIGVPAEAEFSVEILEDERVVLGGEYNIQPVGQSEGLVDDFQPGPIIYLPDEAVYLSANPYPESAVTMGEPAWLREQRVLQVAIYPFQYIPAEKTLVWHKRIRVKINFTSGKLLNGLGESKATGNGGVEESPFEATFKSQLINYEDAKNWRTDKASTSIQGSAITTTNDGFDQTESLGPRYKIVVDEDGIYRLTHDELDAVHEITGTDIDELEMTNQGRNVAIYIEDENDNNTFDSGDAIIFYGQKYYGDYLAQKYSSEDDLWLTYQQQLPDGSYVDWKPEMNAIMMEKYTDDNVYWLTIGTDIARMPVVDGTPQGSTVPETYTTTVKAEESRYWYSYNFSSEDTWFWTNIQNEYTRTYTINLEAISNSPFTATLSGEAVAREQNKDYSTDHHTKIWLNSQISPIIDETWAGISRYHFNKEIASSFLNEGNNSLQFRVLFDAYPSQENDQIYFDWFAIEYSRTFKAENDLLQFEWDEEGMDWTYAISDVVSSKAIILDITDPLTPTLILSATIMGNLISFEGMDHSNFADYIVVGDSAILSPQNVTYYMPPMDFYDTDNQTDYIFITQEDFLTGTETLANYRASQGLSTMIVDFDDLVDEFNYGIYNPLAIKNFLRYSIENWNNPAPSYVLLIGDGHFNFKKSSIYGTQTNYLPPYLSWVDTEQGEVDATNDLATIIGSDALPDVYIGRIPINNETELNIVIQKIISYEVMSPLEWKHHFLFVSDNTPDPKNAGDFTQISEDIISDYFSLNYTVDRVFMDDFCDPGENCSQATNALINELNNIGALFVNYIGHGSIIDWAHETVFSKDDISNLTNINKLPIFLSWTCQDGMWDHPGITSSLLEYETSLVEALIRADNGGAVSTFSPTGLGDVISHDSLNRGFFDAIIHNNIRILGNAAQTAKIRLYSSDPNSSQIHSYLIFGDPALKIQISAGVYLPAIIR